MIGALQNRPRDSLNSRYIMTIKKAFYIIIAQIALISCDPGASIEYRIINLSNKNAIIGLKEGVVYTVHHKDSTICYYSTDYSSAILKHDEFISVYYEWMKGLLGQVFDPMTSFYVSYLDLEEGVIINKTNEHEKSNGYSNNFVA